MKYIHINYYIDDLHPKFIQLGVVDILISLAKSPSLDESILMGVCLAIHNLVENSMKIV